MNELSLEIAKTLVGKTIKWFAPADRANKPYTGIDKIISFDETKKNPFTTESIEGDNLAYAFNQWIDSHWFKKEYGDSKNILCFSDADRDLIFEIV